MAARPSDLTAVREISKIGVDASKGQTPQNGSQLELRAVFFCWAINVTPGLTGVVQAATSWRTSRSNVVADSG